MTDPACVDLSAVKKAKTKTKMSVGDSAKFLAGSKYIRDLATLVCMMTVRLYGGSGVCVFVNIQLSEKMNPPYYGALWFCVVLRCCVIGCVCVFLLDTMHDMRWR